MTKKPRAKDTKWYVVFYEANRKHKLPRKWTPIPYLPEKFNGKSEVMHMGRGPATADAVKHNNLVAELWYMATNDTRAMVFYGSERPRTITEWSVYED